MKLIAKENRSRFTVETSASILKRFYFLQREIVLMQAGWLPGTKCLDAKLSLAEGLWEDSLVAGQLRQRVLELRYPERRIDPGTDHKLLEVIGMLKDAPDGITFYRALHELLKPFLNALFLAYLAATDHLDDGPTVRTLRHALADIEDQKKRSSELIYNRQYQTNAVWQVEAGHLISALDVHALATCKVCLSVVTSGPPTGSKSFAIARHAARDERFAHPAFAWPDRLNPARGAGHGLELQIRSAVHHLNEIWAVEMAAAVLYDLADEAPPEFLEDAARWCFDESRHCRMGYMRLSEFGYQPMEIPMDSFSYDAGATLDPLGRLGIIFYFETTFIHTKSERTKIFAEFGDQLSSHDMDYDWADELIHTYYGNKWLKYFLEKSNDSRAPKNIKEVAEQSVETIRKHATSSDNEETEAHYQRILTKAVTLST